MSIDDSNNLRIHTAEVPRSGTLSSSHTHNK